MMKIFTYSLILGLALMLLFAGKIEPNVNSRLEVISMDETMLGNAFMIALRGEKASFSAKSNEFIVQKRYLNFNITASYDPFRTALNLWSDGKIIRTQTGNGINEKVAISWDLTSYKGKKVYLQIVDADAKPDKVIKVEALGQNDLNTTKPSGSVAQEIEKAKQFAASSIKDNLIKASKDDHRPVYHFRPPSQRMNDPNGTFYANGYYHLFYQHNPLADFAGGGYMLWGHARSRDMVTWEQLPIALWPNWEEGELHCYSGGEFKAANGKNLLFYTGVPAPGEPRQQWAAVATDKDFVNWKNYRPTPVMKYYPENGEDPGLNWRDPFLFEDKGKTFALLTTSQGVSLYEAKNTDLDEWIFRNVIYKTKGAPECPNFFRFGKKWMLVISPQNPVEYAVGTFDAKTAKFKVENKGVLNNNNQYYATQGLIDADGNQILFGLIKGFKNNMGWRDCLALPRILTLDPYGKPLQHPLPALKKLRKNERRVSGLIMTSTPQVLKEIKGDVLEIEAEFELGDSKTFGLTVRGDADGKKGFDIKYENGQLIIPGTKTPILLEAENGKVKLHVFIDKGAIEIYASNGKIAEVRVFYAAKGNNSIAVFAADDKAKLVELKAYQLNQANDINWDGKI
ncbi:Levanase precursor [compost metagenome]